LQSPLANTVLYDALGRATQTTQADGRIDTVSYDGLTMLARVDTQGKNQSKTELRDALGRLVQVTDTAGAVIGYGYDALGQLTQTTPPAVAGLTVAPTTVGYDALGRKVTMTDPDKGTWTYTWNGLGELVTQTDAKGQRTCMAYDLLGRLVTRVDGYMGTISGGPGQASQSTNGCANPGAGSESSTWTFDTASVKGIGQLAAVSGPGGYAESYTYNNRGLLSKHERTVGGVTYAIDHAYDTLSRLEVMTYPGPNNRLKVKHVYNAWGYPTELRDNTSNALYRRIGELDQHGNVVSELYGNGLATIRYHNRRNGVLETIQTFDLLNTPSAQNLAFAFDALGNLTSRSDYLKGFHESFGYDARNRLTATSADWGNGEVQTTALAYDVLGNITSKTGVGNYQYGSQCAGTQGPHAVCRITPGSVGTKDTTYAYDANGNLESGDGRTLTWSRFDKPTSIVTAGASTTLGYGPARELLTRSDTSGGATTSTTYIGGLYERVVLPGGTVEERHYVAGSVLVTVTGRTGGAPGTWRTRYLHTDHLGSVSSITDETGAEVAAFSFDAWGKRRAPTLTSLIAQIGSPWANMTAWQKGNLTLAASALGSALTSRGFTGHEQLDAVGLVHMGGRVYDAQIGRFLSADPFVQDPTDLQGLNRYSYVQNNPLSYTDPSGYFLKKLFRKIGGAIGDAFRAIGGAVKTALVRIGRMLGAVPGLQAFVGAAVCVGSGGSLCAQVAWVMAGLNAAITLANGGTIGQALMGMAVAAVSYGVPGAGELGITGFWAGGVVGKFGDVIGSQVAASIVMGGTIAKAQGGSFLRGAMSAAIGAAAGYAGRYVGKAINASERLPDALQRNIDKIKSKWSDFPQDVRFEFDPRIMSVCVNESGCGVLPWKTMVEGSIEGDDWSLMLGEFDNRSNTIIIYGSYRDPRAYGDNGFWRSQMSFERGETQSRGSGRYSGRWIKRSRVSCFMKSDTQSA
jgi:RHS repeat-associated protein